MASGGFASHNRHPDALRSPLHQALSMLGKDTHTLQLDHGHNQPLGNEVLLSTAWNIVCLASGTQNAEGAADTTT